MRNYGAPAHFIFSLFTTAVEVSADGGKSTQLRKTPLHHPAHNTRAVAPSNHQDQSIGRRGVRRRVSGMSHLFVSRNLRLLTPSSSPGTAHAARNTHVVAPSNHQDQLVRRHSGKRHFSGMFHCRLFCATCGCSRHLPLKAPLPSRGCSDISRWRHARPSPPRL